MPHHSKSISHLGDLTPDPANARSHNPRNIGTIADGLQEIGAARSIVIDEDGVILAGNGVVEAAGWVGISKVQVVEADGETLIAVRRTGLTPAQKTLLSLLDNRASDLSTWDAGMLAQLRAEDEKLLAGLWSADELDELLAGVEEAPAAGDTANPTAEQARKTLAERFIVPPFSVLDARQGYWQERKRAWLALGIQSELGRGDNMPDGGHSDQSVNIDFYTRKRALESEMGRIMTTDEARNILVKRGEIRHVDRSKAARERERVAPKMAMHNDPMQRKARYSAGTTPDASGKI